MDFLRSLLFALLFYLGSAVYVLYGWVISFGSPRRVVPVANAWGRYFLWVTRHVLGIRLVVRGEIPEGAVLIAAKHQSAYETIALAGLMAKPVPVLKEELTRIPFWGTLARRYGSIPVDRDGSGKTLRAMMAAAKRAITEDRPIVIFPEGSRIAVGEAPPLKAGLAGLYKVLKLPVVPLALDSGKLWPRNSFMKRPGTIIFDFGAPIPPGLDRDEIEARLHAAINRPL